jgi:hypothetical protein
MLRLITDCPRPESDGSNKPSMESHIKAHKTFRDAANQIRFLTAVIVGIIAFEIDNIALTPAQIDEPANP